MNEVCPGCGRHCALNEVRCERGREFARTGELPARSAHRESGHGRGDDHGGHGRRGNARQGMEYHELPLESKLAISTGELAHAMRRQEDRAQGEQAISLHREVFGCLEEEEKKTLLMYMEKVCRSLNHRD